MAGHSLASENSSSQCFLFLKKISCFSKKHKPELDFMKEIKEANTSISYKVKKQKWIAEQ